MTQEPYTLQGFPHCKVRFVQLDVECSQFHPGAYWVNGCEYFAYDYSACIPEAIARRGTEEAFLDWEEWLFDNFYWDKEDNHD